MSACVIDGLGAFLITSQYPSFSVVSVVATLYSVSYSYVTDLHRPESAALRFGAGGGVVALGSVGALGKFLGELLAQLGVHLGQHSRPVRVQASFR